MTDEYENPSFEARMTSRQTTINSGINDPISILAALNLALINAVRRSDLCIGITCELIKITMNKLKKAEKNETKH